MYKKEEAAGLLDCQIARLPDCQIAGLPDCQIGWIAGLPDCQIAATSWIRRVRGEKMEKSVLISAPYLIRFINTGF